MTGTIFKFSKVKLSLRSLKVALSIEKVLSKSTEAIGANLNGAISEGLDSPALRVEELAESMSVTFPMRS